MAIDPVSVRSAEVSNRNLTTRWGGNSDLFEAGFVGVPDTFLKHYATLKPYSLTVSEAMFILQLMAHKWTADSPYPSYRTLAGRMGVSVKMARRYAVNLESKGLLKREKRIGGTNLYDLNPLFKALSAIATAEKEASAASGERQ